ncbi:MAG: ribonuclease PH [Alphaproteobacteria bacterium CG_4_10_14_0_8_um_filter_53_9]|nr:MAG: ribonuclease PH [Alphaproteobacteria bacterium CG_4_10_14_0_8_um_filter_53_9]
MISPTPPSAPPARPDNRACDQMRDISLTTHVNPYAEGSCLAKFGATEVLCTASVQRKTPMWMRGQKRGWVTAEYGMLPRATHERKDREATRGKQEGRTIEIQRLIGRSLRSVVNLELLDGYTIWLDCDVMVADGGTRTAAITGAYVALALAISSLEKDGKIKPGALQSQIAAISCGITPAGIVLDMDYAEDANTHADGNFVLSCAEHWIELQISAEQRPITASETAEMQRLALIGCKQLMALQQQVLSS